MLRFKGMRTTITLDPDVEGLLRSAMKIRGQSFKEVLNSAIRAGLTRKTGRQKRFAQKSFSLGGQQFFRWDKALAVADAMEDDELARRLALHSDQSLA